MLQLNNFFSFFFTLILPDCSSEVVGIKSLKIVKKAGDANGSWMKDPTKGSAKIYFLVALETVQY